jgi:hypothetical protein
MHGGIMLGLTDTTKRLIQLLFNPRDAEQAENIIMRECGSTVPCCENYSPREMERIRFAVLKESVGSMEALRREIDLTRLDWRDSLIISGFADDIHAHETRAKELIKMEEANNKGPVTAREVSEAIRQCEYGEYDQNHEWSPSYSLQDKAKVLGSMLDNWDRTEPEGRKVVIQFIRMLAQEAGNYAQAFTDTLVIHAGVPEVVNAVNEFLVSGTFSHDLLVSMKNHGVRQEEWVRRIGELAVARKFVKNRFVNMKRLYKNIQELLGELS